MIINEIGIEKLFDFSLFINYQSSLNDLEKLAMPENWKYSQQTTKKNQQNPILENYFFHTFKRLWNEYMTVDDEQEKQKIIFFDGRLACFCTGLFTSNFNLIFAVFRKSLKPTDRQPFCFAGFEVESSGLLSCVLNLPRRANYFTDIRDLIYDPTLELRANSAHILTENLSRFPPEMAQNPPELLIRFTGALELAKKRVQANYRAAVPTYYNQEMCFMLPMCLKDITHTDLALAVKKESGFYIAKTCLTLDMAYNDARLIAKPDADWLLP